MTTEFRQRFNAAAVFALYEGCAVLLVVLLDPRLLFRLPQLTLGCLVGLLMAAGIAPVIRRLWASATCAARLKLVSCGVCVGIVAVLAMGAAEAWRADHRSLVETLQRAAVPIPWHAWLGWWFDWLLPTGAFLFVLAGAFAARLFGKVACSQTA